MHSGLLKDRKKNQFFDDARYIVGILVSISSLVFLRLCSVYASPTNRIYEEVVSAPTVVTPGLTERTPTTTQPSNHLGDPTIARSASTTTLTSVETEAEPTYAVPLLTAAVPTGPPQPPAPPPVPPKGTLSIALMELGDHLVGSTPLALPASPQALVFVEVR